MSDAQFDATVIELQRVVLGGRPGRPELEGQIAPQQHARSMKRAALLDQVKMARKNQRQSQRDR